MHHIHHAGGHPAVVEALVASCCNQNIQDTQRQTPLEKAIDNYSTTGDECEALATREELAEIINILKMCAVSGAAKK